ncbi:MAG: hypothetical protein ACYDEN_03440 [Acidimicrobiales bacterium]
MGVGTGRACKLASAVAAAGALLGLAVLPAGAAPHPSGWGRSPGASSRTGRADVHGTSTPRANRAPGPSFLQACLRVGGAPSAQRRCEAAALPEIDAARAAEGVGPMLLPDGFATMGAPLQLLVVTDLERVGRGLPAASALSLVLDGLAQVGANANADPPLPSGAGRVGANWAGGIGSTLLTDFMWMYDDGAGSSNLGCPYSSAPGCWAHRRNVLANYGAPLLMGAATSGTSSAVELVGGARESAAAPSWTSIAATIPVALSADSIVVSAPRGHAAGRHVTVWATGAGTVARFTLTGGRGRWWLTRSSCRLRAGEHCNVWFGFRPAGGASGATLVVSAAGGSRSVVLHGSTG